MLCVKERRISVLEMKIGSKELSHPNIYCIFLALPPVLFQTRTNGSHQRCLEWSQEQEMGTRLVSWQRACLSLEAMNSW